MAFTLNYITLLHYHQAIRLMGKKSWIITSKQLSDQYDPLQSYSHILVMNTTTRALQTMRNYRYQLRTVLTDILCMAFMFFGHVFSQFCIQICTGHLYYKG